MNDWRRTILGNDRLEANDGFYQGRRIISRDTPIDGGVSIGGSQREAIVVNSKSPIIRNMFGWALSKCLQNEKYNENGVIDAVYETVRETFLTSDTEELINCRGLGEDRKVDLEFFVHHKAGSCRHRSLAVGVLLEMFKSEGLINGKISIDRNHLSFELYSIGAHAWTRYTTTSGKVTIIDAMQGYCGPIEESKGWDYRRP